MVEQSFVEYKCTNRIYLNFRHGKSNGQFTNKGGLAIKASFSYYFEKSKSLFIFESATI